MTGSGFTVDSDRLRQASGRLGYGADYLGAARKRLAGTSVPASAFGRSAQAAALAARLGELAEARLGSLDSRLREVQTLADKLEGAAAHYDRTESGTTDDFQQHEQGLR